MKNIYLLILLAFVVFISCEKQESFKEKENPKNITYFIDNKEVTFEDFQNRNSESYLVIVYEANTLKSSPEEIGEIQYAFTTEKEYIAFGLSMGYDFTKHLAFEKIMGNYAEKTGVDGIYEKTGKVPTWYTQREKFVYDSIYKTSSLKSTDALVVALYENKFVQGSGAGSSIIMAATYSIMPPGWDNRVSSIDFVGLAGGVRIYNKKFYFKPLGTVFYRGVQHFNLSDDMNDKMSSGVKIF